MTMDSLKLIERENKLHDRIVDRLSMYADEDTARAQAQTIVELIEPLVRAALDLGLVYLPGRPPPGASTPAIGFHPPHKDNPNHYHAATTWIGCLGAYRDHENTEAAINSFREALSELLDLNYD